ncbi:MAG: insulinase family protein [Cephaloticoccus sp.]|nr:insulinase family protein [Cephaloticoccus sp.]
MTGPRIAFVLCFVSLLQFVSAAPHWAHEQSDLAPDPAVHWGTLPNGLRYAIRPNAEPQGRVSMRFVVLAGSMHEADDERGLAHFLEHMAFRSTRDHPAGSLVESLQRLGIALGPENTAFTTYDYTIYHLELPNALESTVREGLGVFRSYADGITFSRDEIERERGVVLSELSTRDKPEQRAYLANQAFTLPEARINVRSPIGLEEQIRHFTPEQFRAFYAAWYRPERMIVTLVGEIDPAAGEKLIAAIFGSLVHRGPARPEPELTIKSSPTLTDETVGLFKEPEIVGAGLILQHATPDPLEPDTRAKWTKSLHASLAFHMLQRRFHKQALRRGASFIAPTVSFGSGPMGWKVNSLSLHSSLRAWQLVINAAEQELRRALEYGFTAAELRDAKIYYHSYYQQGVRSAATTPSDDIATNLAVGIAYNRVFPSAEFVAAVMEPQVDTATLPDCEQAFREAWGEGPPKLFIVANASLNVAERHLAAAYAYSRRVEVLPPVERADVAFAYTNFGPAGQIKTNEHVADLDLWLARFGNGTRFNFKQTDFEDDTVLVSLRVGLGRLSQPNNQPGLDLLANYGFLSGGLGGHTNEEMTDILNGHVISLNFSVDSDAFAFSLRCAPREMLLGMQVLTAIMTDSAYRPEAVRIARAGYGSLFESLTSSPGGPIFATAPRVLSSGDARFGVPDIETLSQRDLHELRQWLEPEFAHSPIEVSVVGDIDRAAATDAIARTIGALPTRQAAKIKTTAGEVMVPKAPGPPMIWPVNPKLRQIAVAYYWPVTHAPDFHTERRLRLLANVIAERLRQRVREEFGAAYSVSTRLIVNEGFDHQNFLEAYAEVEASRATEVDALIRREITAMRREGITADEFERSKQPYLAQREVDLRQNSYWGFTVLRDVQEKPERLSAARDRAEDLGAITARDVQSLLDQYIDPATAFNFRTIPYQDTGRSR